VPPNRAVLLAHQYPGPPLADLEKEKRSRKKSITVTGNSGGERTPTALGDPRFGGPQANLR